MFYDLLNVNIYSTSSVVKDRSCKFEQKCGVLAASSRHPRVDSVVSVGLLFINI